MSGSEDAGASGAFDRRPRKGRVLIQVVDMGEARMPRRPQGPHEQAVAETGLPRCDDVHVGHVVSGSLCVHLEGGEELDLRGGDVFVIPPGHDDWAKDSGPCVLVRVDDGAPANGRFSVDIRPPRAA